MLVFNVLATPRELGTRPLLRSLFGVRVEAGKGGGLAVVFDAVVDSRTPVLLSDASLMVSVLSSVIRVGILTCPEDREVASDSTLAVFASSFGMRVQTTHQPRFVLQLRSN